MGIVLAECITCGGEVAKKPKTGLLTCIHCGKTYPEESEQISAEIREISTRRQHREFIKAEEHCRELLGREPQNFEAHWQLLLAEYGVVYVSDPASGEKVPTFFSHKYDGRDRIDTNEHYLAALEYAPESQKQYIFESCKRMDVLLSEFFNNVAREKDYDIFISFKQTEEVRDNNGDVRTVETEDCQKAREIYEFFKDRYKIFFSPVSIGKDTGITGEKYEPRILKALQTSQAMILVGSKESYLNSQWVENEWSRYLYFLDKELKKSKSLILTYCRNMPRLPAALKDRQWQNVDMFKADYRKDLDALLKPIVKSSMGLKSKIVDRKVEMKFDEDAGAFGADYGIDRVVIQVHGKDLKIKVPPNEARDMQTADEFRRNFRFSSALSRYDNILKNNPQNSDAYWKRFLCCLGVIESNLIGFNLKYAKTANFADFHKAVEFATDEAVAYSYVDALISSLGSDLSLKKIMLVFDNVSKYISDDARAEKIIHHLQEYCTHAVQNRNVKLAESTFALIRKMFYKDKFDLNISIMNDYAKLLLNSGFYDHARVYFEELASASRNSQFYLDLLQSRLRTSDLTTIKICLKVDMSDGANAKAPKDLDLDEILERIIVCLPPEIGENNDTIMKTLTSMTCFQIINNSKKCAKNMANMILSALKATNKENIAKKHAVQFGSEFLLKKKFKDAEYYFTEALTIDNNCADAHWGLLKVEQHAKNDLELMKRQRALDSVQQFNNAINCADETEYEHFMDVVKAQQDKSYRKTKLNESEAIKLQTSEEQERLPENRRRKTLKRVAIYFALIIIPLALIFFLPRYFAHELILNIPEYGKILILCGLALLFCNFIPRIRRGLFASFVCFLLTAAIFIGVYFASASTYTINIGSQEEFKKIKNFTWGNYLLTDDIELELDQMKTGSYLNGGFYGLKYFRGTLDGGEHQISYQFETNMGSESAISCGLIAQNRGGTVRNLKIYVSVEGSVADFGAVAVESFNGKYENILLDGSVKLYQHNSGSVGGLLGYASRSIECSQVYSKIEIWVENASKIGGLIGVVDNGGRFEECGVDANISFSGLVHQYIGGLFGQASEQKSNEGIEIRNSFYSGTIDFFQEKASNTKYDRVVGGLVGTCSTTINVSNSFVKSRITHSGSTSGSTIMKFTENSIFGSATNLNAFNANVVNVFTISNTSKFSSIDKTVLKNCHQLTQAPSETWLTQTLHFDPKVWEFRERNVPILKFIGNFNESFGGNNNG